MNYRLSKGLPRLLITLTVCISTLLLMLSLRAPLQTNVSLEVKTEFGADASTLPSPVAAKQLVPTNVPNAVTAIGSSAVIVRQIPDENLVFTINEPEICGSLRPKVFTLIYVHTAPAHFKHRALIRRTYGSTKLYHKLRTVTVFFLGLSDDPLIQSGVRLESQRYHDIIQADYLDTYKNLSLKAVSALKWVQEHCPNAQYVLKVDDDMFVNVFNLVRHLNFLLKYQGDEQNIHCLVWYNMQVIRDTKSKWFVSADEYANATFPPYCSGSAFFMPAAVAPRLYKASKEAPFLWVDDAYATGVLAKYGGVQHHSISSIVVLKPEDYEVKLIRGEAVFGHMSGDKGVDLRHSYWTKVLQKEVAEVPEVS